VRELVLILPDLFLHAEAAKPTANTSLTALRFAAPRVMRGGWRGMLARGVGREDLVLVDEASVIDAALRGVPSAASAEVASSDEPWIATPLHLMAGLKTVHFPANGSLRLAPSEADELAEEFAKIFGVDGLELVPAGSVGFILRGLVTGGAETTDPARLVGGSLEESLPRGAGSAELRALASELEMWLHALALNRRRASRGEPPVSSLWLWGGGQPPRDSLESSDHDEAARWQRLVGEDAWVQALGRLSGVTTEPLRLPWTMAGADESCCVIAPLADHGLESIVRELVQPLVGELHAGRLSTLVIAANDRWTAVRAVDRYKFWRPQQTVLAALLDSP
jgi:hypothetical protein